ncbi:MAG TPA: amino acid--tRNA ligase-related protein [Syntrophorhabdaceae bacterium]|nr:amino acid--tRNA ligase-related protein [Syntrophorhabdaceae bacterium]
MNNGQAFDILQKRHDLLRSMRTFFYDRGYIEVETPNLMGTAVNDPNIDPLYVFVGTKGPFFLHTSPEMGMKKLLPTGHRRIFQICKVYRVEDHQEVHSTEFTMLEWYREGTYTEAMSETNELVSHVARDLAIKEREELQKQFDVYDLETLFRDKTGIDPFHLGRDELFERMKMRGFSGIDEHDDALGLLLKLYVQELETAMPKRAPYFIKDWPRLISTMAKEKADDPTKVERFELYIRGIEIANGYTELIDPTIQKKRFVDDRNERRRQSKAVFDIDEGFLHALSMLRGSYAGASVGVDRLIMALFNKDCIDDVIPSRLKG